MARTRTSTRNKALTGTLRADRMQGDRVPALDKLPAAPSRLSPDASKAWQTFGKSSIALGTLSEHDLGMLELLARTWSSCGELEAVLAKDGLILESGNVRKAHPALAALSRERALAHRLLNDLGLSPPGRERLSFTPRDSGRPVDPAVAYFSGGRG